MYNIINMSPNVVKKERREMVVYEGAIFGNLLMNSWGSKILVVMATIFYNLYPWTSYLIRHLYSGSLHKNPDIFETAFQLTGFVWPIFYSCKKKRDFKSTRGLTDVTWFFQHCWMNLDNNEINNLTGPFDYVI